MIFNLILFILDAYLSFSLYGTVIPTSPVLGWIGIALVQLIFSSQLWLYFVFFKSSAETKLRFERPLQSFAFMSMGLLSFLFTLTILRDIADFIINLFGYRTSLYGVTATLWISGISLAAFTLGALNARFRIVSPHVQVPIPDLPPALEGFKIVQLSDVHLGTGPKTQHVREMVDRALSLKPDIIALTGDIIDGMVDEMQTELAELARLRAPHGVYFVLGNHECYWNIEQGIAAMRATGAIVLQNEGVEITVRGEKVFIAGLNDPAITHFKGEGPKVPAPPSTSKLNIMLVHQPQIAKKVVALQGPTRYHLQLSGHTHGGQFFPWNWVVRAMYPIHKGLGTLQDLAIYVSSGTGYWGPPIRLGTDGEVTEIDMIHPRAVKPLK